MRRNPEKAREAMRRWRERHRELSRERLRAYDRAGYARDPAKHNSWMLAYHRAHPEVRRTIRQNRRARELAASGAYSTAEWLALLVAHRNRCGYCGRDGPLQVDHRVPIARGGSNSIENLIPACARCNQRKHLLTEAEFRARLVAEAAQPADYN
jgi:5-methylcytosine-specific restriction endonuclease McrA